MAALAVAVGLLLAGCGTGSTPAAAPSAAPAPASGGPYTARVRTLSGATMEVPAGKPTVLYFFTASCGDCAAGARSVGAGARRAGPGAQAVAVDLDPGEPAATMASFMKSAGSPPFALARDDGALVQEFNVGSLGLTVVLDPAGKEVYRGVDPSADEVARALAAARS